MNFSHLYSSALTMELGTDDSTRLFITARRKDAINDAALHWCDLTECTPRQASIPCVSGVGGYNLLSSVNLSGSTDFLRLGITQPEYELISSGSSASTQFTLGDGFPRRTVNWLQQNDPGLRGSTGGTPQSWTVQPVGGELQFLLVPTPIIGSSQTGRVNLTYLAKPAVMTSDTDVPFTFSTAVRTDLEPYHQALVHYAAHSLEKLRANTDGSQQQLQLFNGYLARFFRAMMPKGQKVVRTARNYFAEVRGRRGMGRDDRTPWP